MGLLQKKKKPEKGVGADAPELTSLTAPDVSAALAKAEAAEAEAKRIEKQKVKQKQRSCCGCCW